MVNDGSSTGYGIAETGSPGMSIISRVLFATGALVALPLPITAEAADYDPGVIVQEAPEYVPVEVGSGWYLRGDVTYNINRSVYDFEILGEEAENDRFGGGLGIGYHFNDFFRAEANIAFVSHDEFGFDDGIDAVSAENSLWSGMLNGYVDLGTFSGITPYVGAGAGFMYSKHEIEVDAPSLGVAFDESDREYAFAYSLGAGVNVQMTRNLSVDVGYQYLASPGLEYVDMDTGDIEDGIDYHQVKVGLRYDLW
jgi:opacity protein-like surface antigen